MSGTTQSSAPQSGVGFGRRLWRGVHLLKSAPRMATNNLILVVAGTVLLGSALWGWRRRRTRTGGSVRARRVESPKESVVPPSVPGTLKIAAVDSTRSITREDIASV